MTVSIFQHFEFEVETFINEVLDAVKDKSFSDYILLLARCGYQIENENTSLSPYVIGSNLEVLQDKTREAFLVTYLNAYVSALPNDIFMSKEVKEYDLNIQMMIYAQIWESHQFLKILKRIGGILIGEPYEWKISFEYLNEKGKVRPFPKAKMMEDIILPRLKQGCPSFAKFIEELYDGHLRNAVAHALYYINIDDNAIRLLNSEEYLEKKRLTLLEWEQIFIYSVLLSYHLPHALISRCNNFPKDYPEIQCIEIDWPSYKEPGKKFKVNIKPEKRDWGVEFNFKTLNV